MSAAGLRVARRRAHPGVPSSTYEVVAIFGPTTAGKSAVARRVADVLRTEVVSADALQVYRGLPILTNQPTEPTRLVAIRDLSDTHVRGRVRHSRARGCRRARRSALGCSRRRWDRALPAGRARRARHSAVRRSSSSGATRADVRHRPRVRLRPASPNSIPTRQRRSTRTTGSASCGRSSSWSAAPRSRRRVGSSGHVRPVVRRW